MLSTFGLCWVFLGSVSNHEHPCKCTSFVGNPRSRILRKYWVHQSRFESKVLCSSQCDLLLHLRADSSCRRYFETNWQLCKFLPFRAFLLNGDAHLSQFYSDEHISQWVGPVALKWHPLLRIRGLKTSGEIFLPEKLFVIINVIF